MLSEYIRLIIWHTGVHGGDGRDDSGQRGRHSRGDDHILIQTDARSVSQVVRVQRGQTSGHPPGHHAAGSSHIPEPGAGRRPAQGAQENGQERVQCR